MALFGVLSELQHQIPELSLLRKGINFLLTVDFDEVFSSVTPEKNVTVEIEGRSVFAIFQTYDTKPESLLIFEGHKKYIDIQYIHSGHEFIGVTNKTQVTEPEPYHPEKDIFFTKVNRYSACKLYAGESAVLFPDDLHAPCMAIDQSVRVQKVVVKVLINEQI